MHQVISHSYESSLAHKSDLHLARKLWHIATGSCGLGLYFLFPHWGVNLFALFALGMAILGLLMDFTRLRNPRLNSLFLRYFGLFARKSEAKSFSGFPFYALGVSFALFLFPIHIALLSIFFLVFADPICSYVGIKYGEIRLSSGKSWEGTFAGLVVCYLITLIYCYLFNFMGPNLMAFAFGAALFGALSEHYSFGLDDNLTIPLASGAGMWIWHWAFPVFSQ